MLRTPKIPRWIPVVGLTSSGVAILSTAAGLVLPQTAVLRVGVPIGILGVVLVCIPALGIVMWRWKNEPPA